MVAATSFACIAEAPRTPSRVWIGTKFGSPAYPKGTEEPVLQSQASFFEAAGVAIDSLRGSKLRSFLTLFGIILSTTTLIAVMSLINGMDVYIATSASSMGTEGFRVLRMSFVGRFDPKQYLEAIRRNPLLIPEEFDFIKSKATL